MEDLSLSPPKELPPTSRHRFDGQTRSE
ncbi:hypothetical protein CCACVL1_17847 [Corchorus capsularis]|uniref:Uncharacterized protein n=1 Tax=Corchorus capsularis TaxID=210143 RepID=A0A1R3HPK4_COCAP|nr:hypothetical protein CCACVL1_17847 [Corchorus capsularis]